MSLLESLGGRHGVLQCNLRREVVRRRVPNLNALQIHAAMKCMCMFDWVPRRVKSKVCAPRALRVRGALSGLTRPSLAKAGPATKQERNGRYEMRPPPREQGSVHVQ